MSKLLEKTHKRQESSEEKTKFIPKHITAIDIGTTKIVALIGMKSKNGKIKIVGAGSAPTPRDSVKRGVVLNIDDVSNAIKIAVEKAEDTSGVKVRSAFIGIAGQHIKSQKNSHSLSITSEDNEITENDLKQLHDDMYNIAIEPGEAIIHVIPQNYMVDKESGVRRPAGMFGKKLVGNYHIVIGEITSVQNIQRCIHRNNIQLNTLFLEPLASAEAVLTPDEREAGVALVDIGGGTTDIAVYYDGILRHTAVIPYGGNVVTSDIKKGCSILEKHAEKVKLEYGKALSEFAPPKEVVIVPGINGREEKEISVKRLAGIIQARMIEICKVINFELDNSNYRRKLGAGISLTGGGSLLAHLPQLMKLKTGLDVKLAIPGRNLTGESIKLNNPKYSTAVGLLELGFQNLDKINEVEENENSEKNAEKMNDFNNVSSKKKILEMLKGALTNFFDDKDSEIK